MHRDQVSDLLWFMGLNVIELRKTLRFYDIIENLEALTTESERIELMLRWKSVDIRSAPKRQRVS